MTGWTRDEGIEDGWGFCRQHRRSHRTSCKGPDPTNFWESEVGHAQYGVAKQ